MPMLALRPSREGHRSARLAALACVGVLACAPPPLPTADTGSSEPSIRITWPPPETPIQGCEIVAVEVENLRLVEFPTGEIVEGEGHYHIYHPGGYEPCHKPYCFVDFSDVPSTTEPYFTAVLANNVHTEMTDENGDRYEHTIPFEFVPGDCALTDGDTGAGY